jgi:hypothetical protein
MQKMKTLLLLVTVAAMFVGPVQSAEVPEKSEIKKLTTESMTSFGEALKQKDFTNFYENIAEIWKKQTTPEKLLAAFESMTGPNFDILGIVEEMKPTFEPAAEVNSDGVLIIKGYYPTKPNRVFFELKYLGEDEEWKLVGINVKMAPPSKEKE